MVKVFGTGDQQLLPIPDRTTEVIGQSAVGKGNVRTFFEDDNFRIFGDTAQPCSGSGTAGNATDDKYFHVNLPG